MGRVYIHSSSEGTLGGNFMSAYMIEEGSVVGSNNDLWLLTIQHWEQHINSQEFLRTFLLHPMHHHFAASYDKVTL
jgi:hypothetical protein